MYKILNTITCVLKFLKNKMHANKERRFAVRNRSYNRKNVLRNANESVSAKQQNLEELLMDLELEDIAKQDANKPLLHHDVAAWVSSLKNQEHDRLRFQEMLESRKNQARADDFFENQKLKNIADAQFLREKTFSNEGSQKATEADTADLQDLYEETKNLRRIVDVYNLQKMK